MAEILAYCGSCKMDLTANVVAKVGGKIVKVQCRTCKKEHTYKPAKGVKDPGAAPPPSVRKARTSSDDREPAGKSMEAEWTRLMNEAKAATRVKYSIKAKLQQGDVVDHPSFGQGIVMRVSFPDKAEILFRNDLKMLIHSKP